jgi:hypothetical protein
MRSVMPGASWTWCYVHKLTGHLRSAENTEAG